MAKKPPKDRLSQMVKDIEFIKEKLILIEEKLGKILEHGIALNSIEEPEVKIKKPKATTEEKAKEPKINYIIVKNIEDYISKAGTNLSYKLTNGAGQNCYVAKSNVKEISEDNTKLTVLPGKEYALEKLEWK